MQLDKANNKKLLDSKRANGLVRVAKLAVQVGTPEKVSQLEADKGKEHAPAGV